MVLNLSTMKAFIVLFGLVSMTMAHPSIIQLSPQSIHASAAASASSLSSPQRLVQIIPGLPIGSNSRLIDTIETAAQAQAQQQIISGPNSLLTATRQAQSIASINPTGASSVSSAQVIESPQANAARIAQQEALAAATTRQALRLPANRPLFIGLDGHLVAESPLILA